MCLTIRPALTTADSPSLVAAGIQADACQLEASLMMALARLEDTDDLLADMRVARDMALGAAARALKSSKTVERDNLMLLSQLVR